MKIKVFASSIVLGAVCVFFNACKDDDKPRESLISFEVEEQEVTESDGKPASFHPDINIPGLIQNAQGRDFTIKLTLDRPLAETTILQYGVSGTATRTNPAGSDVNDFAIKDGTNTVVSSDKITIQKGATEASIVVTVFEDFDFEVDDDDNPIETAIITLQSVVSGTAKLGEMTSHTLKIKEDDALIFLLWGIDDTDDPGDVDLDLFVWLGDQIIASRLTDNNEAGAWFEGIVIPGGLLEGNYALSYTYYSGSSDNVDLAVIMWGNLNNQFYPYFNQDETLVFGAKYTQQNINKYDEEEAPPPVKVQTMVKQGVNFNNISTISVPVSGSRIGSSIHSGSLKKFRADIAKFKSVKINTIENFDIKRVRK